MLQPELKLRRDKIRWLMAQQGIDAALITCNVNLLYTYGRVISGYLYLPLFSLSVNRNRFRVFWRKKNYLCLPN